MTHSIQKIIILGGGTAGWMAAAALSKFISHRNISITLIESPEIGTIGVGEATIPGIRDFNLALGIDEIDLIKKTSTTFKLGIEFIDWHKTGSRFFHPFSHYGQPIGHYSFYSVWQLLYKMNKASDLENYCLATQLAKHNRFAQPKPNPQTPLAEYHYAYHFDASLYAQYLKAYAIDRQVKHIEGKAVHISQHEDGAIKSISLNSGQIIEGDFFIDCSGLRGLLIEETLNTGYEDWSHWLPVNSAVAVQSKSNSEPTAYTKSTAISSGWKWRIPLQHRVGNGYVYSDQYISDEHATQELLSGINEELLTQPRVIKFTTGRRKKIWNKNCFALGLASGFLEPLESTSISLIQTGLAKLIQFFPESNRMNQDDIDEVNRQTQIEMERIRDFILLHYRLSERSDSAFWQQFKAMDIPTSLQQKIKIFKRRGHLINYEGESFKDASWISIYNGFGVLPDTHDMMLEQLNLEKISADFTNLEKIIEKGAISAPKHQEFINRHCAIDP